MFNFLFKNRKPDFTKGTPAHEVNKDVLYWEEGDVLVQKLGKGRGSGVPRSNFWIFVGFPSKHQITLKEAYPMPGGFKAKHDGNVITGECAKWLPKLKNYSLGERAKKASHDNQLEEAKNSRYMEFLRHFKEEYDNQSGN